MMPLQVLVEPVITSTPSPAVKGPFLPTNCASQASSAHLSPMPAVWVETSTVRVAMAPSSFRVTNTVTSPPLLPPRPLKPGADAVSTSAAGAVSSAAGASSTVSTTSTATPMATLAASTTALEVTVAPVKASMLSPTSGVAFLPMNWFRKASSSPQRVPKPWVSPVESTTMPVITLFASTVRVTVTSDWKPFAVPVSSVVAAGASSTAGTASSTGVSSTSAGRAAFTASMTALEVTVAPVSTSASTGAVLPTNWFRKASSSPQRVPKPWVSPVESTTMPVITPASSAYTVTFTSDWKPFAAAS